MQTYSGWQKGLQVNLAVLIQSDWLNYTAILGWNRNILFFSFDEFKTHETSPFFPEITEQLTVDFKHYWHGMSKYGMMKWSNLFVKCQHVFIS